MNTLRDKHLLSQSCTAKEYVSDNAFLIRQAVNFDHVAICERCSGAEVGNELFHFYHPTAHLSAQEIVSRLSILR